MRDNGKTWGYCALSGFVLLLYSVFYLCSKDARGVLLGGNYNLISYVIMLLLVCAFIGVILLICCKKAFSEKKTELRESSVKMDRMLAGVIVLSGIAFLFLVYLMENTVLPEGSANQYIRSQISKPFYAVLVCFAFAVYIIIASKYGITVKKGRWLAGTFFAALCAFCCYSPNLFSDDYYHIHAYTNSIVHVANLNPFDQSNISIYGHYGLLYLPFVKLFGNDYTAIALSIALAAFASYYFVFDVCNKWIRKDSVYFLSILAICTIPMMFYRNSQYYQVQPHRLLFPAASLFFVSRTVQGNGLNRKIWLGEFIIGTLGVIWNLETGIIAIAVFCLFNLAMEKSGGSDHKSRMVRIILKDIALSAGCILGAYLTINLYSFAVGSRRLMSFGRFIFPLDNQSYQIDELKTPLCTPFCVYMIQLIVFSCVMLNASQALFRKDVSTEYRKSRIVLLCVAISGFGSAVYFVNRMTYANIAISWIQMILAMGILGDEGLTELSAKDEEGKERFYSRIAGKMVLLLYVFAFAIEGCMGFETTIQKRLSTSWDTGAVEEFTRTEASEINEYPDILAFGYGVPELMFQIHRNDVIPMIDWSDMNEETDDRVDALAHEYAALKKPIFVSIDYWANFVESWGYSRKDYDIGKLHFALLLPKDV